MAGRGGFAAITLVDLDRLMSLDKDRAAFRLLDKLSEQGRVRFACPMDKAWQDIHRWLTDERFPCEPLLGSVILASEPSFSSNRGEDIYLKDVTEVPRLAARLNSMDEDWLRQRWLALEEPDEGAARDEDEWEYVLPYFEDMKAFYARAAAEGLGAYFSRGR